VCNQLHHEIEEEGMRKSVFFSIGVLLLAVLALSACAPVSRTGGAAPAPAMATMANPASVYCAEHDGKVEIRDGEGGEVGYCIFPDGSECEEWAFFRGECTPPGVAPKPAPEVFANMANPASVYCTENGGALDIRQGDGGEVGYCVFANGAECEEWAFFRGECSADGLSPTPAPTVFANMPNPASVYCTENGGALEIRQGDGGEVGICVFPGGAECDEWAFFRGECKP
jgi:putative hemolysin